MIYLYLKILSRRIKMNEQKREETQEEKDLREKLNKKLIGSI
jgi:hypothetical protein